MTLFEKIYSTLFTFIAIYETVCVLFEIFKDREKTWSGNDDSADFSLYVLYILLLHPTSKWYTFVVT